MYILYMDLYRQMRYNKTIMGKVPDLEFATPGGEKMSERSNALKKAQQKYMEKFSIARVRMEHDRYERVQAHAAAQGESVNGFINQAIDHEMERDSLRGPTEAAEGRGNISTP